MKRRHFLLLTAAASAGAVYTLRQPGKPSLTGEILGASDTIGHRLRGSGIPAPTQEKKLPVLIVGGGIAGLSAAWKLSKAGFQDFMLVELEAEIGGNARSGANRITAYPWGAHYIPLPTRESRAVRELLADLGVLHGDPQAEKPVYAERYLCFTPQERLYLHGVWQEGLWPQIGVSQKDRDQYRRFQDLMADFQRRRGRDGRRAFAIPMALSADDSELHALDRLSIRDFLLNLGLDSAPLHWYVDYACRDDYGCRSSEVSAWAGIHYFASRDGMAHNAESDSVLTWPEGNGWIVNQLRRRLEPKITTSALAFHVAERAGEVIVDVWLVHEHRSIRIIAEELIWASPTFLLPVIMPTASPELVAAIGEFQYAPWLVANLSLREFPTMRRGAEIAWDNVIYDSDSLGYVVATHQSLATHAGETVFTYYYPLAGTLPAADRQRLLTTPWHDWVEWIMRDLAKPHPDIREKTSHLDIFRWGHAMIRPRTGFIGGAARQRVLAQQGRVHLAHSDLSGFSVFEEAQYRGVLAAEQVLHRLGITFSSSLDG